MYILKLKNRHIYIGCTSNINERMLRHRKGYVPATKTHRPLELIAYTVFKDRYKAFAFEKYLKSGSGRAFLKKRFI